MGLSWIPTADTYYQLTIEYTPLAAFFYVNGKLLHKKAGAHQSYFMTLPITIENLNTAGSTNVSFESVGMYIARQGELVTNGSSKTVTGVSTTIYKYGAGVLKGIILSAVTNGAIVNIYDGLTTGGVLIWTSGSLPVKTEPFYMPFWDSPFSNGLTLDISVQTASVFLAYE